ncbi:hypothetical protein G6F57_023029 [Rhizopus arrhizus]|nr:hypothetical protein G6F57_023029 [Rhizopus arrhizus]
MAHRTRAHLGAQSQFAGVDAVFAGVVEAVDIARTRAAVGQGHVTQRVRFIAAAETIGGPPGQLVAEVIWSWRRARQARWSRLPPSSRSDARA